MSRPEDIPQDVWNTGAKMAGEYFAWLNAGNSRGNLSEHAVAAMADTIARAILAAKAEERVACISTANAERVSPFYVNPAEATESDKTYDMAIDHVTGAIRKRAEA